MLPFISPWALYPLSCFNPECPTAPGSGHICGDGSNWCGCAFARTCIMARPYHDFMKQHHQARSEMKICCQVNPVVQLLSLAGRVNHALEENAARKDDLSSMR